MINFDCQCWKCKHWKHGTCPAFPNQTIPEDIDMNRHDHRQPFPGDHGIRWQPKDPGTKHPMDEKKQ